MTSHPLSREEVKRVLALIGERQKVDREFQRTLQAGEFDEARLLALRLRELLAEQDAILPPATEPLPPHSL